MPQTVSRPVTLDEAAAFLAEAAATGRTVTIGEELDPRGLDRILEHEAGDLTCTVEAGVRLSTLRDALAPAGQRLALDPPGDPTIGACIAAAHSGPLRHRYGTPSRSRPRSDARPRRRHDHELWRQGREERRRLRPREADVWLTRHPRADRARLASPPPHPPGQRHPARREQRHRPRSSARCSGHSCSRARSTSCIRVVSRCCSKGARPQSPPSSSVRGRSSAACSRRLRSGTRAVPVSRRPRVECGSPLASSAPFSTRRPKPSSARRPGSHTSRSSFPRRRARRSETSSQRSSTRSTPRVFSRDRGADEGLRALRLLPSELSHVRARPGGDGLAARSHPADGREARRASRRSTTR